MTELWRKSKETADAYSKLDVSLPWLELQCSAFTIPLFLSQGVSHKLQCQLRDRALSEPDGVFSYIFTMITPSKATGHGSSCLMLPQQSIYLNKSRKLILFCLL